MLRRTQLVRGRRLRKQSRSSASIVQRRSDHTAVRPLPGLDNSLCLQNAARDAQDKQWDAEHKERKDERAKEADSAIQAAEKEDQQRQESRNQAVGKTVAAPTA